MPSHLPKKQEACWVPMSSCFALLPRVVRLGWRRGHAAYEKDMQNVQVFIFLNPFVLRQTGG